MAESIDRRRKLKDIVLLYDNCCIYEIVILNYFLKCTGGDVFFCSVEGNVIRAVEGYSINTDMPLNDVDLSQVRSLSVPGGEIAQIDRPVVMDTLRILNDRGVLIAGICAGVDLLERAGYWTAGKPFIPKTSTVLETEIFLRQGRTLMLTSPLRQGKRWIYLRMNGICGRRLIFGSCLRERKHRGKGGCLRTRNGV